MKRRKFKIKRDTLAIPNFLKKETKPGGPMTRVQFKIMGGKSVKRVFYRTFDTVKDAAEYFQEFSFKRKYSLSKDGLIAMYPGTVDSISSNMSIPDVLKLKAVPKVGLPDIVLPDQTPPLPAAVAKGVEKLNNERVVSKKPKSEGVPLKVLCGEIGGKEGRDARIALRKAVRDAKKYPELSKAHSFNARWEFDRSNAELMKELKEILS